MADVLVVLMVAAFMAVCVGYVWWCDSIIGADPMAVLSDDEEQLRARHGASTAERKAAA